MNYDKHINDIAVYSGYIKRATEEHTKHVAACTTVEKMLIDYGVDPELVEVDAVYPDRLHISMKVKNFKEDFLPFIKELYKDRYRKTCPMTIGSYASSIELKHLERGDILRIYMTLDSGAVCKMEVDQEIEEKTTRTTYKIVCPGDPNNSVEIINQMENYV